MENWQGGADEYRGDSGPLAVCNGNGMKLNPLYETFIAAGREAGYPVTPDYNGYQQEGFGPMHMTVSRGVRWSTANAFLKPVLQRPNLTVITGALITRIVLGARTSRSGTPSTWNRSRRAAGSVSTISKPRLEIRSRMG
jgi:choline dehydrogenase